MTKQKYRIIRGRYARWEGNAVKEYKVGDPIELTDQEAAEIASLVEREKPKPPKPLTGSVFRNRE